MKNLLSETQRSGGVERLQICVIFPFVRDTSIAQQLCHGFIQAIDSVAADCLQVKTGIAGVIQNRGILAAVQQGVCMPKRLLPLEGEEILRRILSRRFFK
mgnify:CR=1 FL=1